MSESVQPDPDEVPTHRRTIVIDSFDRDGELDMVATLRDDRPWAEGTGVTGLLHDMTLRVRVRRPDLVITDAEATMHRFPHPECPEIEDAFEGLVGLSVARGYTKAVQDRFGRAAGCSHLEFLARAIGPAVIQALNSSNTRHQLEHPEETPSLRRQGEGLGWLRNTCHIWSDGGVGEQLIELGWQGSAGEYPSISLVELRRQVEERTEPGDAPA